MKGRRRTPPLFALAAATLVVAASVAAGCAPAGERTPLQVESVALVQTTVPTPYSNAVSLRLEAELSRTSDRRLTVEATLTNSGPATYSVTEPLTVVLLQPDGGTLSSTRAFRPVRASASAQPSASTPLAGGRSMHQRFLSPPLSDTDITTATVYGGPGVSVSVPWRAIPEVP